MDSPPSVFTIKEKLSNDGLEYLNSSEFNYLLFLLNLVALLFIILWMFKMTSNFKNQTEIIDYLGNIVNEQNHLIKDIKEKNKENLIIQDHINTYIFLKIKNNATKEA